VYLAEHTIKGGKKYMLRDSHYDAVTKCWLSRDLYDLGRTPSNFIKYLGGNAFYIDERIGEHLENRGLAYDLCELEELFWRFLKKDIRQKLESFHRRGLRKGRRREKSKAADMHDVHIFDRRRFYYLRCGRVDQRSVNRVPQRYFAPLVDKSRDEIEQYFIQLEKCLKPKEYKQYVYVIFDLQRHFVASSFRYVPHALDQEELDRNFLTDLCRLHKDKVFWAGFHLDKQLHEYLVRYAVMFFDYEFDGVSAWEEYLQNFINSKRFYRPPPPKPDFNMDEVVEIFGVSEEALKAMDKSELTRLFRRKAHELHPDKGGEHGDFVRLTEVYKELMRRKR
jgi:hypothetical protein